MLKINEILISIPAVLIAIGFHEAAHAFVAYLLGDNTAKNEDRLSINPFKHIDPLGFIMLFVLHFGWAKPVPINSNNFKNKKIGIVLSSIAGPLMNFLIALIFLVIEIMLTLLSSTNITLIIFKKIVEGIIVVNIGLGVFNLIPLPPLDGSKILFALLPTKYYYKMLEKENILQIILIVLIITNVLSVIISPLISIFYYGIEGLAFSISKIIFHIFGMM